VYVLELRESGKRFFHIRRTAGVVSGEIEGRSTGNDDGQTLVGVFCQLLYACYSQCVVAADDKCFESLTGGGESPIGNVGFGLGNEVIWTEILV
jgi:hypothetical protein